MSFSENSIRSMTGFSSVEREISGIKFRLELKTLNHRFLDIKVRLPRHLSSSDLSFRSLLQTHFSRGSIELKLEQLSEQISSSTFIKTDLSLAAQYYECILNLQRALGLNDPIRAIDIASYPEVIIQANEDLSLEAAWPQFESFVLDAIQKLREMREHEGQSLKKILLEIVNELEQTAIQLRERKSQLGPILKRKTQDRIKSIFELYPIPEGSVQTLLESRIAQELSLLMDRTDIEEELTRFQGHLDHFRKTLSEGGPVGRKCDFILQELNREINTLGNKAQDASISEDVVQVKLRLEQLREQVMNLE